MRVARRAIFWRARSKRTLLAITATCIFIGLASMHGAPALAARTSAAMDDSMSGGLLGVAATTANNAWAVGYTGQPFSGKVLMLHWNGKSWSRVTRPGVLNGTSGQLSAITAVSAKDAWAVGYTGAAGSGKEHSLILHWNGATWSQLASPAIAAGELLAVTANATSGWAVGYLNINRSAPGCCLGAPLILRLTGSKWSRFGGNLGRGAGLDGVAATSAKTAWAIAEVTSSNTSFLLRWNGSRWFSAPFPVAGMNHFLAGIAAGPGGVSFAVGEDTSTSLVPISMKWTGKTWQKATVSAPSQSELNAVAFAPGGAAWAAGVTGLSSRNAMVLRWNGKAWSRVASPGAGSLDGLAFAAAGDGWAVGTSGAKTLILHWNGKAWS